MHKFCVTLYMKGYTLLIILHYRLLFKNAYDPHLYQEVDLQSHWNTVRKLFELPHWCTFALS